jgi:hypothetical protein
MIPSRPAVAADALRAPGRVRVGGYARLMSETFTTCPICGVRIEPDAPDSILVEKVEDHPGHGQEHDYVWSRAGYAHARCLVGARKYRAADV